jgi:glycogen operon protein
MFQDPVIARSKLIAEPWDVTHQAMQLGNFPAPWREWNAKFRDDVRRFWNGRMPAVGDLATRLSGSSDLFAGRGPLASINFVTAHDGFTLRDLVSYSEKHNESNGEKNRDGNDQNDSTNFGFEGDPPATNAGSLIAQARARQLRNFLTTLILAPGVPMLTAGDEMFRTQRGNNNAYVCDDETSWLDWNLGDEAHELLEFSRALIKLRKNQVFSRSADFFRGGEIGASKDLTWFRPDGKEMVGDDWSAPTIALGAWFSSLGEDVIFIANATALDLVFSFPGLLIQKNRELLPMVDTRGSRIPFRDDPIRSDSPYALAARSLAFLRVPK